MRDSVDKILADWAREEPALDFSPVGIITRLARVRGHLDDGLSALFARYDLSPADFQVLVALRRSGTPYRLAQARLMSQLALTSGTVSVRINRLERRGVVAREPDPNDARVSLVRLTEEGLRLFDAVAPAHLANEDRLLSALDEDDRLLLTDLLRKLLLSFEHGSIEAALPWGLRLEPAHRARERRVAAGLSDTAGLLVAEAIPGTPAAEAGVAVGDLLIEVCGHPVRDEAALHHAVQSADPTPEEPNPAPGRRTVTLTILRAEVPQTIRLVVPE